MTGTCLQMTNVNNFWLKYFISQNQNDYPTTVAPRHYILLCLPCRKSSLKTIRVPKKSCNAVTHYAWRRYVTAVSICLGHITYIKIKCISRVQRFCFDGTCQKHIPDAFGCLCILWLIKTRFMCLVSCEAQVQDPS